MSCESIHPSDHCEAEQYGIKEYTLLLHGPEQAIKTKSQEHKHEESCATVERQSEGIDEEQVEISRKLRQIRYDSEKNYS
jgi:hypothetical protein